MVFLHLHLTYSDACKIELKKTRIHLCSANCLQMNWIAQEWKCVILKRAIQVYRANLFSNDEHYSNNPKRLSLEPCQYYAYQGLKSNSHLPRCTTHSASGISYNINVFFSVIWVARKLVTVNNNNRILSVQCHLILCVSSGAPNVAVDEINGEKILVKLVLYWAHAPTTHVLERQTYTENSSRGRFISSTQKRGRGKTGRTGWQHYQPVSQHSALPDKTRSDLNRLSTFWECNHDKLNMRRTNQRGEMRHT
jgi:hypothetical protein